MKFKHFKIKDFIINSIFVLIYPAIKGALSTSNKIYNFFDALIITSLIFIVIGVINSLYLHGDFDISHYFLSKIVNKNTKEPNSFLQDVKDTRKNSFNYVLFIGLLFLLLSLLFEMLFYRLF